MFKCFKQFVNESETFLEKKVCKLRGDNGGELANKKMKDWCENRGITRTLPFQKAHN